MRRWRARFLLLVLAGTAASLAGAFTQQAVALPSTTRDCFRVDCNTCCWVGGRLLCTEIACPPPEEKD